MQPHRKQVEDFTLACLVMGGVVLFNAMFVLWALFGYLAALGGGALAYAVINRLPRQD